MSFLGFLYGKDIVDDNLFKLASSKGEVASRYICDVLTTTGDISEDEIAMLKADFYGLEYTDLSSFSAINDFNYADLEPFLMIPFENSEFCTKIAISDPEDFHAMERLSRSLSLCEETRYTKPIYHIASKEKIRNKFLELKREKGDNTIDDLIYDAILEDASDVHIIPFEKVFKILFRIDGTLREHKICDIANFEQLEISLKVLAKLDISESRRPQSGHFPKGNIDLRISTHPTYFGESIVIRILNKDKSLISIEKLGFLEDQVAYLKKICALSTGMIIFCGPTGSGKTTSIYSLIETMDKKSRNIMTLEDPIEYKISNVRQTEIIRGVIEFADGVRSILRQDPDVVLIGEIRDPETAQMAIRASMTGHLILTTIHSSDSLGAISRLQDFGVPSSTIGDNLIAIVSQRLVRRKSGRGRMVISEILKVTPKLREGIYNRLSKAKLEEIAKSEGFIDIKADYDEKVKNGLISKLVD